jgi:hypothetical protein
MHRQVLAVKAALRASREAHDQLPLCREREIAQLQPWLRERLQTGHGGSSYVAGTPGVGEHLSNSTLYPESLSAHTAGHYPGSWTVFEQQSESHI